MQSLTSRFTPRQALLAIAFITLAMLAFGFVLEHGFNVLPCPMCWWQRYAHATIVVAAFLGAACWPKAGAAGMVAASLGGAAVAAWQVAAQQGWLPFPASCSGGAEINVLGANLMAAMAEVKVIPCDAEGFTLLGLSLAAWNLPLMLLVAGVGLKILLGFKKI